MYYSLVIPVFNEEKNIQELYWRLTKVMNKLEHEYEVIFINDGSSDNTQTLLTKLHKQDAKIKVINFSRNFGHQTAVTAGLHYSRGQFITVLDADLQDPPEILPRFFAKLQQGYDVVYAIRTKRKDSWLRKTMYYFFYRLLKAVANITIPLDSGDFCVMTRRVVDIINQLPERNRFVRGLRSWVGFSQVGLTYERDKRYAGESKYNWSKMLKLAFDGIFSFSYIPLQILTWFGFSMFILSIIGSLLTVYFKLFTDVYIPRGFPTTIIVIMFIGGINMLALGIMGEYIGRIYDEVKQRAPYVVESTLGFKAKT
jgi:polyisoprenyl-phosphate glycosyltransferase